MGEDKTENQTVRKKTTEEGKKADLAEPKVEERISEENNTVKAIKRFEKSMSTSLTSSDFEREIGDEGSIVSDLEKSGRRKSRMVSGVSFWHMGRLGISI